MKKWFLFIFFLQIISVLAQPNKSTFLSLQQGLSNQQVLNIAHDEDGFVWIATELGLNRFASNSFQTYYKKDNSDGTSVNSNEINALLYDQGLLFIGTRANGLNVLDIKNNHFSYYTHNPKDETSIATNDITDIIKGKDGYIWIATYHQGIQRFDTKTKKFSHYNKDNLPELPENGIWSLLEDQQGLLYIGHISKGLSIFDKKNKTLESFNTINSQLPDGEIKSLFCDPNGNIWIGTRKGLAVYNPQTKIITPIKLTLESKSKNEPYVYSINRVNQEIWVGTESSQLFVLQPEYTLDKRFKNIRSIQSYDLLRGNRTSIQDVSTDKFGNVWLALYGGGIGFVSHFKPFFNVFTEPQHTSEHWWRSATVTAILQDQNETLSLATEGDGILQVSLDKNRLLQTNQNKELEDIFFLTAFQDKHQNRWFGMQKGGVAVLESHSKRWQKINLGMEVTEVRAIMEDQRGDIWIAAKEGLFVYKPTLQTTIRLLLNQPMLGDYAPRALLEDSRGRIWVGTYGQGLYIYNIDKIIIRKLSTDNLLKSNTINHLFRDKNNNIWIATNEGIVFQSANQELGDVEYMVPQGANAWLNISALAEDENGNIWGSTKAGLLRYLPQDKRFLAYDESFGLPLGGFVNNSVMMDSQNRLFFGMHEGICYFEPTEIPLKLQQSPIKISRFTVFQAGDLQTQSDRFVFYQQNIELLHHENSFRIELAVMDYALNNLVEFSYKLNGLDSDWIFLGDEKNLDFRNIPYGSYELLIRTRLKNEDWSNDYVQMFINISPPFYLSTLAIIFYTFLVLSMGFILIFFYTKKINAESELKLKELQLQQDEKLYTERLNFYTNITHELRTPLTLILGPLDDLLREDGLKDLQKSLLKTVQKSANRLFTLVNQLLEFRKVESQYKTLVLGKGYLGDMLREIGQSYQELNTKKTVSIICNVPEPDTKTSFDAEIVQLVIDNLLTNAIKHTERGSITINLKYEQERLVNWALIEVTDTGCGIPAKYLDKIFHKFYQTPQSTAQGTGIGIGLALVKELVTIHNGKISVISNEKEGTTFSLRLLANVVLDQESKVELSSLDEPAHHKELKQEQTLLLLVEDDIDLRTYLAAALRKHYKVIEAVNGKDALQHAKKQIPDIIISDIMMPDMDGFQFLENIREELETSHIPFVFLTAKDTELDRQRGYELGVDSYLTKPIGTALLYGRVDNLLVKQKTLYTQVLQRLTTTRQPEKQDIDNLWRENAFIQDFVRIVEAHMQDEVLDAASLSEKLNMSQSTLYRKLKGITGKNINQLVRKIRVHKAAEILRSGNYNITEVAFMVGINSPVYFRQCFKEEFDQLPSEYQKNHLNNA